METHARARKLSSSLSKVLAERGHLTFVGNGNLEGSALVGVLRAVRGGGQERVISWKEIEGSSYQIFADRHNKFHASAIHMDLPLHAFGHVSPWLLQK